MRLIKATTECPTCGRQFYQIDGTEDRALSVVRNALAKHQEEVHPNEAR